MKQVFVSGGAGFIGTHLCDRLVRDGVESITVYDNFSSGNRAHGKYLTNLGVKIVEGDLRDLAAVVKAMSGADTLFHLAANPDISKAVTEPDIDFVQGTLLAQNVFEAARRNGVGMIFYTSGSGVYGENAQEVFSEDYGPLLPISTYGASKLGCEALLCAYCHMFGIRGRAFRFANVVGPRQTHGVGYDFIRRLTENPKCLRILGDGTQSKSYIYIDDVINAILTVKNADQLPYDIYNVATGDYVTVSEIAHLAMEVCGLDARKVAFEYTGGNRGWKGDVPIVRFNTSKIQNLGWHCQHSSADALRLSMAAMKLQLTT
jgi:UDP-glucose 4-epimerase